MVDVIRSIVLTLMAPEPTLLRVFKNYYLNVSLLLRTPAASVAVEFHNP